MTPTDRPEADRLAGFIDLDDEVSCNPRARAELAALRALLAEALDSALIPCNCPICDANPESLLNLTRRIEAALPKETA